MNNPTPKQPATISEVWAVGDADVFAGVMRDYLYHKEKQRLPLSVPEQNVRDICDIYAEICINGFNSLFYQVFSLADCQRVEAAMREMGLHQLAKWFAEALHIYCRGQSDLTEETYDSLDPFSLEEKEGQRFDEIGELFTRKDSELFKIAAPLKVYAEKHRGEFS